MLPRIPQHKERYFRVMSVRGVVAEEISRLLNVELDAIKSRMPRVKRKYTRRKKPDASE